MAYQKSPKEWAEDKRKWFLESLELLKNDYGIKVRQGKDWNLFYVQLSYPKEGCIIYCGNTIKYGISGRGKKEYNKCLSGKTGSDMRGAINHAYTELKKMV